MTTKHINPTSMGGEPGTYSNGILVESPESTLYIAGQIGIDANGASSHDFETQTRQAWSNVEAILREADMTLGNIVKTTIYLVDPKTFSAFSKVRTDVLGGHKPASTLVYVSALAKPEWMVEIDVVAVR